MVQQTREQQMRAWSACELRAWLESVDAAGLGSALHANAANGTDFLTVTEAILVNDLRLSGFAARKLIHLRQEYLAGSC